MQCGNINNRILNFSKAADWKLPNSTQEIKGSQELIYVIQLVMCFI